MSISRRVPSCQKRDFLSDQTLVDQIILRVRYRDAIQRRITELDLEYYALWDAAAWEIHTAIIDLALDNPDMLVSKLEEIREG